MSSSTWTPAALSSEARLLSGTCWRLVEAQHRVSTLKLVDTVEEQSVLEDLIQDTKPVLPAECAHLHYLLSTPFRYGAVYPAGSRFRRAGLTEGVFYAAARPQTAVAEIVFYRLLLLADAARSAEVEVIRYMSVRDPRRDANLALLTCQAFARPKPVSQQTWHIRL